MTQDQYDSNSTRTVAPVRVGSSRTVADEMTPDRAGRDPRRFRLGADGGFTMIELLLVVIITAILGGIGAGVYAQMNRSANVTNARSAATSQLQDASTALTRDVADAQVIQVADATRLQLLVVRADLCEQRTYTVASGEFQVQTAFYAQATCAGPTTTRTVNLVDQFTVAAPFGYIDTNLVQLTTPVTEIRGITAVQWHLARSVAGTVNGVDRTAAEPYSGKNLAAGNGKSAARALAPVLSVTTNSAGMEGRDQPQLTWVDESPSVTTGWKIYRAAWPEGGSQAAWSLAFTILDKSVLSWTDTALPAGWTAQYEVQPTVAGGTETPTSNVVTTGLRPAAPTGVTATGQPTSILVAWAQDAGATGYDVFRDGALLVHAGNVLSYTDTTGYGHSHTYTVVGWNRWEALVLGGTQTATASIGDATTKTYRMSTARLVSASSGAFTAPAAPVLTATANADWTNTLTWTPAAWVGAGPTSLAAVSRDRGWVFATDTSTGPGPSGSWSTWSSETAAATTTRIVAYTQASVAGQYRSYEGRTCNPIGCSPASAAATTLQRPPVPSCTAAASGVTTRSATVTLAEPAMASAYTGTQVGGGSPAPGYGVVGTGTATSNQTVWSIDQLAAGSAQVFTAATQNASPANGGWSDSASCSTVTAPIGVSITSTSSGTRWINAIGSAINGTSQDITLEGVQTLAGTLSGYWDPLSDGVGYTVTARNSDGVNAVAAQASVSTKMLYASSPTCSATVTEAYALGGITVSGGNVTKLGSSGWSYGSPYGYTGLSAGTYTPYAGNKVTDGWNTVTAWDSCPSQVIQPAYSTAWGSGVSYGCPGLAVFAGGSQTWEVRRASDSTCQLQWVVSDAGSAGGMDPGTVMSAGTYVLGSGATAYTPTSGAGPFGPLYWG